MNKPRTLRILFFSSHPHLGLEDETGYGTHMREMISAFKAQGNEVDFMIAGRREVRHNEEKKNTRSQSHLKRLIKFCLPNLFWETVKDVSLILLDERNKRQLQSVAQELKPDVIYERSHYGMIAGVLVARDLGIHHVLEVNCPNVDERIQLAGNSLLSRRARRKDRWAFANSSHVLTVSTHLAQVLSIDVLSTNWNVTPNAIRPGLETESRKKTNRNSLNIDNESILLGFVGSIFPWHGVDIIIKSVHELQRQGIHAEALVVGDGEIVPELKLLAFQLGVSQEVHFIGSVSHPDTFVYTKLCDILVMPRSNAYGSPVKIFEYALVAKPCIVPETSPVTEVMDDGVHGWVIKPEVRDMIQAVIEIVKNRQHAMTVANTWRNKVLNEHTWMANAKMALEKVAINERKTA